MIEIRDMSVRLGSATVVREISIDVASGEWVALIGPNGAGKTTILRAVAGLVSHAGSILVDGRRVGATGRRELARRMALVPQLPQRPAELTVA
ncbi:MAG TPA: ABC transporter ATP-binding protein, partial [Gaiellaceae bacterium]